MLEIIESFNKSATTYDDWYEQPLGEYALRAELKGLNMLLPHMGLGAEIGAGTGMLAKHLSTRHRTILCIDPAIKMLNKAHKRGLQGILGTAESPPTKSESLGFIYLVIALEFLHEPTEALCSLRDLLKSRSPIILLTINKKSLWGSTYSEAGIKGDPIFRHATFYTLQQTISFLEQARYKIDVVFGALLNPPNIVPKREPHLVSLSTEERTNAGVFLIRGIKI